MKKKSTIPTVKKEPTILTLDQWDISHLRDHLQSAVNLEFWTIPFYMSAMYSIKDRTDPAYQLIRTVVNQEMLHLQTAANIANAYGLSPTLNAPVYKGDKVPYIDFSGDAPDELKKFLPYTAEIGPLDLKHINAMCLIEIPESLTGETPDLNEDSTTYGSIGQFYQALRYGAGLLRKEIRGGVKQVDYFGAFYRNMPSMTITESGENGFHQVDLLIDLITEQGEGEGKNTETMAETFRNTADDSSSEDDHFDKFMEIKNGKSLPATFKAIAPAKYNDHQKKLEAILIAQFTELRAVLEGLFGGENPQSFFPIMASVGGAIRNCWENGVTPKFS